MGNHNTETYDHASTIVSSRYRTAAMKVLTSDGPQTPGNVADRAGFDEMAHISRAISELREEGLVELLTNDDKRKGRIYGVTDAGEEAFDVAEGMIDDD